MLIGKTSALTMNIAGVIKDWMLIFLSYYLFRAPVTALNLFGYAFCCSGVSTRSLKACSSQNLTGREAAEHLAADSMVWHACLYRCLLMPHHHLARLTFTLCRYAGLAVRPHPPDSCAAGC